MKIRTVKILAFLIGFGITSICASKFVLAQVNEFETNGGTFLIVDPNVPQATCGNGIKVVIVNHSEQTWVLHAMPFQIQIVRSLAPSIVKIQ